MSEITNKINEKTDDLNKAVQHAINALDDAWWEGRKLEDAIEEEGKTLRPASSLWLLKSQLSQCIEALKVGTAVTGRAGFFEYPGLDLSEDITEVKA